MAFSGDLLVAGRATMNSERSLKTRSCRLRTPTQIPGQARHPGPNHSLIKGDFVGLGTAVRKAS
jgi:hypothetical protein